MRASSSGTGSSSKKRKQPEESDDSDMESEEPVSSGDASVCETKPTTQQVKIKPKPAKKPKIVFDEGDNVPQPHTFRVDISEPGVDLGRMTDPARVSLTVVCEFGDSWFHIYERRADCHKKVLTGDSFTDRIMGSIPYHGYCPIEKYAEGKFGKIILATSIRRRELVALKFIIRDPKKKLRKPGGVICPWQVEFPEEFLITKELSGHLCIVDFVECLNIDGRLCLVTKLCENGDIDRVLSMKEGRFISEPVARRYFRDMFTAVEYVHHQGYAHRDIKLENFLVDNNDRVKLADFGSACKFNSGDRFCMDAPSSSEYTAPEVIMTLLHMLKKENDQKYDKFVKDKMRKRQDEEQKRLTGMTKKSTTYTAEDMPTSSKCLDSEVSDNQVSHCETSMDVQECVAGAEANPTIQKEEEDVKEAGKSSSDTSVILAPFEPGYDPRLADVWSLGVVLFIMATGHYPYHPEYRLDQIYQNYREVSYPDVSVMVLSKPLQELINGLLAYVTVNRFTLNRIRNCEWFTQEDKKVSIGNYHLACQPQKLKGSEIEKQLKLELGI